MVQSEIGSAYSPQQRLSPSSKRVYGGNNGMECLDLLDVRYLPAQKIRAHTRDIHNTARDSPKETMGKKNLIISKREW